ncbi:hypothetical protein B0H14DRAFT_2612790 [Mycena olivaceomarginata]|nr:hypothetical protein B0H14DRAFT_2612790 [Mycena olivaceomarginata]
MHPAFRVVKNVYAGLGGLDLEPPGTAHKNRSARIYPALRVEKNAYALEVPPFGPSSAFQELGKSIGRMKKARGIGSVRADGLEFLRARRRLALRGPRRVRTALLHGFQRDGPMSLLESIEQSSISSEPVANAEFFAGYRT